MVLGWDTGTNCLVATFGDGNLGFRRAAKRVARQALGLKGVSESIAFHSEHLERIRKTRNLPKNIFKGWALGHYAWKPFIALEAIEIFKPERLIWLDAGNWVNVSEISQSNFNALLSLIDTDGGFIYAPRLDTLENLYTAPSVLSALGVSRDHRDSPQLEANLFGLHRSQFDVLEEWSDLVLRRELLVPKGFEQGHSFQKVHHRYDQSLLSLTWKKRGLPIIQEFTGHHPGSPKFKKNSANLHPFWTSRHRSGMRTLSMNPFFRALRAFEKFIP